MLVFVKLTCRILSKAVLGPCCSTACCDLQPLPHTAAIIKDFRVPLAVPMHCIILIRGRSCPPVFKCLMACVAKQRMILCMHDLSWHLQLAAFTSPEVARTISQDCSLPCCMPGEDALLAHADPDISALQGWLFQAMLQKGSKSHSCWKG